MLGSRVPSVDHWLLLSRGYVGQSWEQYLQRSFGFISGIRERVARCLSRQEVNFQGGMRRLPWLKDREGDKQGKMNGDPWTGSRQRASPMILGGLRKLVYESEFLRKCGSSPRLP